jgi:hypothetical protein
MRRKATKFTGRAILRRHRLEHMIIFGEAHLRASPMAEIGGPLSGDPGFFAINSTCGCAEFTNVYARRYGSKRHVVAADRQAGEVKFAGIRRPRAA